MKLCSKCNLRDDKLTRTDLAFLSEWRLKQKFTNAWNMTIQRNRLRLHVEWTTTKCEQRIVCSLSPSSGGGHPLHAPPWISHSQLPCALLLVFNASQRTTTHCACQGVRSFRTIEPIVGCERSGNLLQRSVCLLWSFLLALDVTMLLSGYLQLLWIWWWTSPFPYSISQTVSADFMSVVEAAHVVRGRGIWICILQVLKTSSPLVCLGLYNCYHPRLLNGCLQGVQSLTINFMTNLKSK